MKLKRNRKNECPCLAFLFIKHYLFTIITVLLILIQLYVDAPSITEVPRYVRLAILTTFVQVLISQFASYKLDKEKPCMQISNYGTEPKNFPGTVFGPEHKDISTERVYFIWAYIDINCTRSVAENIYPQFTWYNENDEEVTCNQGRWFYPTADAQQDILSLQTANLFPNSMPRRIHIGGFIVSNAPDPSILFQLQSIYRRQDGVLEFFSLASGSCKYMIKAEFRSSNGACLSENFIIKFDREKSALSFDKETRK